MIASRPLHSIDFGAEPLPDLHALLARARTQGAALRVLFFGEPAWLISRYDDVSAAFAAEETMPAAAAYSLFAEPVQGRTLQCMTGSEHRANRTLVSPAFRPAAIRALQEMLASLADELAGGLEGQVDLITEFAARLPYLIITRMLGLNGGTLPELRNWATALFSFRTDPSAAAAGSAQFTGFLADLLGRRRAQPRNDLISRLATAENPDGTRLTDEEIFSFIRLLFPAGADTTYRGIGSLLYALLAHPTWWEKARDDPDARSAAIEEALRWEPPVAVQPRRSITTTTWGDTTIPADQWVLFGTAAANRDPARFPHPDAFAPDRHPTTVPVLTFGAGPHYCLGAHLARAEMHAALAALATHHPHATLAVPPAEVTIGDAILRGPKALPAQLN